MRILIAEDDLTSRTILSALLKKWGYEVVEAKDGAEALKILCSEQPPRMAILDWNMPEMDGAEVCSKLRAEPSSDPPYLILLTARDEKESIVLGLEAGASDYLTKPYNNDELHARIRVGQRVLDLQESLNKARDALAYEAMHDALTGVLNRRAILDVFEKEIARAVRSGVPFCVAILDIDHFKKVNDTYGHQVGDDVLVWLARMAQKSCRAYDCVGRYGGEEFLLIFPGCASQQARSVLERIRNSIASEPVVTRSGQVRITVSVGYTVFREGLEMHALLGEADAALYRAKKEGRNRVVSADYGEVA